MIGYLKGKVLIVEDQKILLDVNGVGYEVFAGPNSARIQKAIGDELELWISTYVREDQITLFGFPEAIQKRIFLILISVSGIGPKLAMAIVAQMGPGELLDAVVMGNVKTLCSVPGIGRKMAERMILELKDKLGGLFAGGVGLAPTVQTEISVWRDLHEALAGLGFPEQRIRNVINLLRSETAETAPEINQLLKMALQKIRNC